MSWSMFVRRVVLLAAAATFATIASAQQTPLPDISLDSLLNTRVSAASKYYQTVGDAPGSVMIVSSDDIKSFGYRNLQEVLENVRGFYVSNDRNYAYLGVRGFSQTQDYNNRVLLLVDGHSLNEQVFGAAPIGTDLPINLDIIERIEIVQGPGSALYGTGAIFAVINIVTKTALALDGGVARLGIGSAGERSIGLTTGHSFGSGIAVTASGLFTDVNGNDQFYPEYDSPATGNGIARGLDWEHAIGGYGKLTWAHLSVQTGYRTRSKGIPTAQFGMLFGDPRAETMDETLWADVALEHEWGGSLTLTGRLYGDRSRWRGTYPFDVRPRAFSEAGGSGMAGGELILRWAPVSRLRLSVGTEDKFVHHAVYSSIDEEGVSVRDNAPFRILSGFAQSELQLLPSAMLVTGVRVDRYSTVGSATTPRLGLIVTPDARTTVKVLYGEAFRAPSAVEALLTVGSFLENPLLKPERIAATEINAQRRLGDAFLLSASAYRYAIENLIGQAGDGLNTSQYQNLSHAEANGLELQLDARQVGPLSAQLSYALQSAVGAHDTTLANSPQQIANLGVMTRAVNGVRAAIQLRYESARRTSTSWTSPFLRTDGNVGYRPSTRTAIQWLGKTEMSLRVTNLFGVAYATPSGAANLQDSIAADGRTYALRLEWHF
jgi:iron complex outermembrane receptor protein